jgi:hypothetical protein
MCRKQRIITVALESASAGLRDRRLILRLCAIGEERGARIGVNPYGAAGDISSTSVGDLMRAHQGNRSFATDLPGTRADKGERVAIRCVRRRWSTADLHYLHTWVGVRPIHVLCRYLRRTERALRCKLHTLGLSAKVREGWGMAQLRRTYHVGMRTVLRHVVEGKLRLQCAQVRAPSRGIRFATSLAAGVRRWHGVSSATMPPIGDVAARWHRTISQVCAAALAGQCRLIHVRITEATAARFQGNHRSLTGGSGSSV